MIGYFNYTMILTYMSIASASLGIIVTLAFGNPYAGMFCLLFSGLCDAFDGKVARTKKNRSDTERKYGIQIDSLSDIVAFGVLPVCIGVAILGDMNKDLFNIFGKDVEPTQEAVVESTWEQHYMKGILIGICVVVVLVVVALIVWLVGRNRHEKG